MNAKLFTKRVCEFLQSEDGPTAVEYAVMLALIVVVPTESRAIPAFARKYGVACSTCHVVSANGSTSRFNCLSAAKNCERESRSTVSNGCAFN